VASIHAVKLFVLPRDLWTEEDRLAQSVSQAGCHVNRRQLPLRRWR